jgi:secondary thiamine-phosphate synthase enzyme
LRVLDDPAIMPVRAEGRAGPGVRTGPRVLDAIRSLSVVVQKQIQRQTRGPHDIHDLTDELQQVVTESGIQRGIASLCNVGSTAALGTIEFEPGLQEDLPALLDRLIPPNRDYRHERAWHDGNGHSHLQATLLGPSLTVPVDKGRLVLGTWQQVFLLECDVRPRRRSVVVTVIGE